jgi:ATP-dependent helicase HrpA
LKALRRRLAKLPGMRGAVADAQYDYLAARRRYQAAAERAQRLGADPTALVDWRWHLEEYAVQLFAQDLRTRVPISAKRLAAMEAAVTQGLARL